MKYLLILLIIGSIESRATHTVQRKVRKEINNERNKMDNKVVPTMVERKVFDTRSIDQEALQLLLNSDYKDDNIEDLSEESSGDFEPDIRSATKKAAPEDLNTQINAGPTPVVNAMKNNINRHGFMFKNGWIQYKYEKAFILVNQTATRPEAERICDEFNKPNDIGAELAVPQSDGEQSFLNHYMFNMSHCLKNVWIGQNTDNYRNGSSEFKLYANWAKGMPTMTKPCVQIRSPYTIYADMDGSIGAKWEDVSCYRQNVVLCQKPQHWSEHQFIRVVTELKKDVEELKHQSGIDAIPPGFIYIQLPNQLSPKQLWPNYDWKDISFNYAGLFFRAVGGRAASFGIVQEATSPRLNAFKSYGIHGVQSEDLKTHEIKADDNWSGDRRRGTDHNSDGFPVSFKVSGDEVKPRNTAIRIWKRI